MKRISIALSSIGFSLCTLAALPAATDPTLVNVPQLPGGFFVGGTAYYLEAIGSNSDGDYARVDIGTTRRDFPVKLLSVDPEYDWGWGEQIGYIFPNTANDISLKYFQIDTDSKDFTNIDVRLGNIRPLNFFVIPRQTFFPFSKAEIEYDVNQLDLTAGQTIDVGCRLVAHTYAGLRWARLQRGLDYFLFGFTEDPILAGFPQPFFTVRDASSFSGIGPLVGFDASYYIFNGIGAVTHVESALLVGDISDTANFLLVDTGGDSVSSLYKTDENHRVVPAISAKLGLDYSYLFDCRNNSDLTLEAGWQFNNYFNVPDKMLAILIFTRVSRKTSDIGINGPYVSLTYHV